MSTEEDRRAIISLSRTKGFGVAQFFRALEIYGSPSGVLANINRFSKKGMQPPGNDEIKRELEEGEKLGVKIITYTDDIYPNMLKNIGFAPLTLSCRGNLELLKNGKKLAIVGSRDCSLNSFNFTKKISREIANNGYVIVSGMARGIDTSAHIGSMDTGTIAVLGCGIDVIYPKQNEYLYYKILENNGLIISEFFLHSPPIPDHFRMRNRIVVGMSRGVLITSAGEASGTLNSANYAIKFGKELMVFPGNPYDGRYTGSNNLLKEGATIVTSTEDIIECLDTFTSDEYFSAGNDDNSSEEYSLGEEIDEKPGDLEDKILSMLDHTPIEINNLVANCAIFGSLNDVNSAIMKLRVKGKIILNNGTVELRIADS
ncbi:MAG: DNA-processing protein DprA [Rickettsiales bacterium]|jgi:DNA processing protein|nr:DNA-processing protein DprA [Rickettsiales bacterium]